jgi:hypothetical protein
MWKGHYMNRKTHGTGVVDLDENLVLSRGGNWDLLDLSLELRWVSPVQQMRV